MRQDTWLDATWWWMVGNVCIIIANWCLSLFAYIVLVSFLLLFIYLFIYTVKVLKGLMVLQPVLRKRCYSYTPFTPAHKFSTARYGAVRYSKNITCKQLPTGSYRTNLAVPKVPGCSHWLNTPIQQFALASQFRSVL